MHLKKLVIKLAIGLFVFLCFCSVASFKIYKLMLPEVKTVFCENRVPAQSVYYGVDGAYVMHVAKREGLWGDTTVVEECLIKIKSNKGMEVLLKDFLPSNAQRVIYSYTRELMLGEEVTVKN